MINLINQRLTNSLQSNQITIENCVKLQRILRKTANIKTVKQRQIQQNCNVMSALEQCESSAIQMI